MRCAKATRAVLLPDRWCAIGYAAGAPRSVPRLGQAHSRRTAALARLAGDRQPRVAARRRSRVDGRLRRRARERHGARGHAAAVERQSLQQRGVPLRSRHRHARAAARRRPRMDQGRRADAPRSSPSCSPRIAIRPGSASLRSARRPTTPRARRPATARQTSARRRRPRQRASTGEGRAAAAHLGARHRARRLPADNITTRISPSSARRCT